MKIPQYYDPLFGEAGRIVVQHQQGSASLLQRRLKLGYNRASRLVDELEQIGVVGPFEGSKARQVLFSEPEDLDRLFAGITFFTEDELVARREKLIRGRNEKENLVYGGLRILDYDRMLSTNENQIGAKGSQYILNFVRLGRFLREKEKELQKLWDSLETVPELILIQDELNYLEAVHFALDRTHMLNCLLINAIAMMTAFIEDKMVQFYTMHEKFDEFGVFNNAWQNEVSNALSNIHSEVSESNILLKSIVESINDFQESMEIQLDGISFSIDFSINDLQHSMERRLKQIDNTLDVGNEISKVIAFPYLR